MKFQPGYKVISLLSGKDLIVVKLNHTDSSRENWIDCKEIKHKPGADLIMVRESDLKFKANK